MYQTPKNVPFLRWLQLNFAHCAESTFAEDAAKLYSFKQEWAVYVVNLNTNDSWAVSVLVGEYNKNNT